MPTSAIENKLKFDLFASTKTSWELLALLRFFLALIVVAGHLSWFSKNDIPWALFFNQFGGKSAVIGFLLVSGFSIAASQNGNSDGFLHRRFYRIYPLYFFAIALTVGLELNFQSVELPKITITSLGWTTAVGNLLLLQTFLVKPIQFDGPLWSLSIEFFFYICATQFSKIPIKFLLLLVIISVFCFLLPKHEDFGILYLVASKFNALKYFWCWMAGYLYWHHRSMASTLLMFCGLVIVSFSEITAGAMEPLTYALSVSVLLVSSWVKIKGMLGRIFTFLGDFSYPLYLFHLPAFILAYSGFGIRKPEFIFVFSLVVTLFFFILVENHLKPRYLKKYLIIQTNFKKSLSANS